MAGLEINLTKKQGDCRHYLSDMVTTSVGYGGAAGGGKSYLGCTWINTMCIAHPGSRWFIARNELKRLKQSTLMTLLGDVIPSSGLEKEHYNYKQQDSQITYWNGSMIFLLDASRMPSDPMFSRFGSIEVCGGFVDEGNEIRELAFNILLSRCRYRLDDFGIIGKVLATFNPDKGRVYQKFYKPFRDKKQAENTKFVTSLATDNKYISKHYIENLKELPEVQRQRLLNGNFDYDNTPGRLYAYDDLCDMFTNPRNNGTKYITCDVARMGNDKAVIMVRDGREVIEIIVYDKCTLDVLQNKIAQLANKYKINMKNVIVDADGVGAGIRDNLRCQGFQNGSSPIQSREESLDKYKPSYQNLKTQCYFELRGHITKIRINDDQYKEEIVEELDVVCQIDIDKDVKIRIIKKEDIIEKIGRSPDFADCIMFRAYRELKPKVYSFGGYIG